MRKFYSIIFVQATSNGNEWVTYLDETGRFDHTPANVMQFGSKIEAMNYIRYNRNCRLIESQLWIVGRNGGRYHGVTGNSTWQHYRGRWNRREVVREAR